MRSIIVGLISAIALAAPAHAGPVADARGLKVVGHIPGPDGHWDYASFDPERRRVYVSHGDEVLALGVDSGILNVSFAPGDHLHAIVAVPHADVLVTTNSGDNSVRILRASSGALLKSLSVAPDADGAAFDPATGLVMVINGEPGLVTLIDPIAQSVDGTIKVGDALEFGAVDGRGRAFVNIESTGEVAVLDLVHRRVLTRYKLDGCQRPTGLAYVEGRRVISACANNVAKVLDARTGQQIASLKIGPHPDSVLVDPVRHRAFVPTGGDGMLSVIALTGSENDKVIAVIPTHVGARTGAVDPKTGCIYLPTAEFGPPSAPGQRLAILPASFQILVVGNAPARH